MESYNGFFSSGEEGEMMMMMVFFYDESVWREPLLVFVAARIILSLYFFWFVSVGFLRFQTRNEGENKT